MIVLSPVSNKSLRKEPKILLSLKFYLLKKAIDGARFITSAVFVIDHIKGMPIRNCPVLHKLDLSMLAGIKSDLDFAWPDWPEKDFRSESALQREWVIFASCFMEFMKSKEVWKDEQEFFEQGK